MQVKSSFIEIKFSQSKLTEQIPAQMSVFFTIITQAINYDRKGYYLTPESAFYLIKVHPAP